MSKRKGYSGENEFAKLTGGKRVPLSGAMEGYTNDVILPNAWQVEVKRRKEMEKTLYSWLLDEREKPDIVAFRADRMPWVVSMTLDKFMYLMEVEIEARKIMMQIQEDGHRDNVSVSKLIDLLEERPGGER